MLKYISKKKVTKNEPKPKLSFEIGINETDLESLTFIYEEAKIRVDDTVKDHHETSKKVFQLLLLFISISSFISGYLFKLKSFKNIDVIICILLAVCIFASYILIILVRPTKFRAPGRAPSKLMTNKVYKNRIVQKNRMAYLIYQELLHAQAKIELNQYYNTHRLNAVDFIIRFMLITVSTLCLMALLISN